MNCSQNFLSKKIKLIFIKISMQRYTKYGSLGYFLPFLTFRLGKIDPVDCIFYRGRPMLDSATTLTLVYTAHTTADDDS